MTNFQSYLTAENLLLFAFMLLAEAAGVIFNAATGETPASYEWLKSVGYVYAIGNWVEADGRRQRAFRWPYCRGIFLHLIWMFIVPYYLFKTRGRRAFLTLLIFAAMYAISVLLGAAAATLSLAS